MRTDAKNKTKPRKILAGALLWAASSALAPGSFAATCTLCSVHLTPAAESIPLPIEGWLISEGSSFDLQLVEPPDLGFWDGTSYRPGPAFHSEGSDTMRFWIDDHAGLESGPRTVYLFSAPPRVAETTREDFEDTLGQLSALEADWQVAGGDGSLELSTQALEGHWSLRSEIVSSAVGALGRQLLNGDEPAGNDEIGAEAIVNTLPPDVPPPPGGGTGGPPPVVVLELSGPNGPLAQAQLRYLGGQPEMRAVIDAASFDCGLTCTTPWRQIPPFGNTRIGIWLANDAQSPQGWGRWNLRFEIEPLSGARATTDELDTLGPSSVAPADLLLGALGGAENEGLSVSYDVVVLHRNLY